MKQVVYICNAVILLLVLGFFSNAEAQQKTQQKENQKTTTSAEEVKTVELEEVTPDNPLSVSGLVEDCKLCSKDKKSDECIWCDGVLTGAATAYAIMEGYQTFCPPRNLDTWKIRNYFRRWALKNQDKTEESAVKGVMMMMKEYFPCKAQ